MIERKLIGLLSDTHGRKAATDKAIALLKNVDMILHAGDYSADCWYVEQFTGIKCVAVLGNCDMSGREKEEELLEIAGHRVFLTHGDKYRVKSTLKYIAQRAEELEADVCVYGHSHVPSIERVNRCLMVNPGSAAYPRLGVQTCGLLTLTKGMPPKAQIFALDEK